MYLANFVISILVRYSTDFGRVICFNNLTVKRVMDNESITGY